MLILLALDTSVEEKNRRWEEETMKTLLSSLATIARKGNARVRALLHVEIMKCLVERKAGKNSATLETKSDG